MVLLLILIILILVFAKDTLDGCLSWIFVLFILGVIFAAGKNIYSRILLFIDNQGWINIGLIVFLILVVIYSFFKILFIYSEQKELANLFLRTVAKNQTLGAMNLLKRNPNVNARNSYGETPLVIAIEHGNLELIKELIKTNANVNARDNKKQTPLMIAVERGNKEIVKELIKAEANVNARDKSKWTPLIIACTKGNKELVRELIKANANLNLKAKYGETAYSFAKRTKDEELINMLIAAGAKKNR